jgi:hypothetical protein
MDEDVDFSGWELPRLQDDPDRVPPPEREYSGGVWIGSDLGALSQRERVDALLVLEQHRAWLDGLQQQVLAEVSRGDPSADQWIQEEVACALGLSPVTAGTRLKNAEQLCTRLPATPECRRDHRVKHQARWQVRRNPDGTTTWTSPQGREYTNHPPARWKVPGE